MLVDWQGSALYLRAKVGYTTFVAEHRSRGILQPSQLCPVQYVINKTCMSLLPTKTYLVCATERSGSTLLAEGLNSTGLAGTVEEYFEPRKTFQWVERRQLRPTSFVDYAESLMRKTQTPNGVFRSKIFWHQLPEYFEPIFVQSADYVDLSMRQRLDKLFLQPKYVWLSRRDKLAQAISEVMAIETNVWLVNAHPDWYKERVTHVPTFNFVTIRNFVERFKLYDACWEQFFASHEIAPFRVIYEEFEQDYEGTLLRLLDYLEIERPADLIIPPPAIAKQRTELNAQWAEQYQMLESQGISDRDAAMLNIETLQAQIQHLQMELRHVQAQERIQFMTLNQKYTALAVDAKANNHTLDETRATLHALQAEHDTIKREVEWRRSLPYPSVEIRLRDAYRRMVPFAARAFIARWLSAVRKPDSASSPQHTTTHT